ncbi:hypothetical protein [Saccharophagus degradans]|nr:hypothetical protein [Saccharophagus degradans]
MEFIVTRVFFSITFVFIGYFFLAVLPSHISGLHLVGVASLIVAGLNVLGLTVIFLNKRIQVVSGIVLAFTSVIPIVVYVIVTTPSGPGS